MFANMNLLTDEECYGLFEDQVSLRVSKLTLVPESNLDIRDRLYCGFMFSEREK